jgi:hypothetical protein
MDVAWLKANKRTVHCEREIFERMKNTFGRRRKFILEDPAPTASQVLEMFPRLLDTDGLVSY